jgi:hypothetical protein
MTRKILFGAATLALLVAGFGVASFPALAELRVITITLEGGQEVVTTVDVPPGTPPEAIQLPEISAPVKKVEDGGPPKDPADEADKKEPQDKTKKDQDASPGEFLEEDEPAKPKRKKREKTKPGEIRTPDGAPTADNPTLTLGLPGPAPVGVPNFVISKFRIPPFLLPIYQAAGTQYGIRWEVLAAINEIETDYGRNLNVSSAGALGWMQFIPSSWRAYGTDANRDGEKDPYNPVDAIFAAARYLKAAGAEKDLRRAIFAYNHADWYVDSVLLRSRLIAGVPVELIGSLTGLTEGRFPVAAPARYADDLAEQQLLKRVSRGENAANLIESAERRSIDIFSRRHAPVVAVNDGVIKRIGRNRALGRHVVLEDVYGNRYTYAQLGEVAALHPVLKNTFAAHGTAGLLRAHQDVPPDEPASAGRQPHAMHSERDALASRRLFANPYHPYARGAGGREQQLDAEVRRNGKSATYRKYFSRPFGVDPSKVNLRPLRKGSRVIAGTIIGRVGLAQADKAPHLDFSIRPAGRGAPLIDPKPILDGWKLLEATAIYRANGKNVLRAGASVGQILLLSKSLLEKRVLADERIQIYSCGRDDIRAGQINRRVLATLAYLSESGLSPTVTSLRCGHSYYTKSGHVSDHSSGNAVDISRINNIPVLGHQEPGGVVDHAVRRIAQLQGALAPSQVISLFDIGWPTLAMADHADHIHVGFHPAPGDTGGSEYSVLKPYQWPRLLARLAEIRNPIVETPAREP